MRIIEENKLKDIINIINEYENDYILTIKGLKLFKDSLTYYNNINQLNISSLQSLSLEEDLVFFDEVSFILSVISSIIAHPHLTNRGEDIIIRAELAGSIPADAFNQVVKEPIWWKEQDYEMIPENVHYYQYTDELKIYENIFIGMLVNLLSLEMSNYQSFYVSLIPSFNDSKNKLDTESIELALKKIDRINRRIRFVKNTFFYKEVSKAKLSFKNVQPTNILMKDRLYNLCFKFYRKFIKYEDKESLFKDFKNYYHCLILKVFKNNNFILDESIDQSIERLNFRYNDFNVTLIREEEKSNIELIITRNGCTAKHQLLLNTERSNNDFVASCEGYLTSYVVSLWNLNDLECLTKDLDCDNNSEYDLISKWLFSHFKTINGNRKIYQKYCPVCVSKSITNITDDKCSCDSCGSLYSFIDEDNIWFIKIRR